MTKEAKNSLNLPGNIVWMAPLWLLRRRWLTEFCLLVIKHGNLSQGSWSLKGSELRNSHTNMWKPSCPFQSILRRQWCPMLTKDSRKKTISCWRFATTLARDKKGQWIRFSATLLIQFVLKDTDYFQNTTRCQSQKKKKELLTNLTNKCAFHLATIEKWTIQVKVLLFWIWHNKVSQVSFLTIQKRLSRP